MGYIGVVRLGSRSLWLDGYGFGVTGLGCLCSYSCLRSVKKTTSYIVAIIVLSVCGSIAHLISCSLFLQKNPESILVS